MVINQRTSESTIRWIKRKTKEASRKKSKIKTFEVGQEILRENPNGTNKLGSKYEGPYTIISKIGDTTYYVQRGTEGAIREHGSQMKPYYATENLSTSGTAKNQSKKSFN